MAYATEEEFSEADVLPDFFEPVCREGSGVECIDDGGILIDPVVCGQQSIIAANR
jgi:hypothetical protein